MPGQGKFDVANARGPGSESLPIINIEHSTTICFRVQKSFSKDSEISQVCLGKLKPWQRKFHAPPKYLVQILDILGVVKCPGGMVKVGLKETLLPVRYV